MNARIQDLRHDMIIYMKLTKTFKTFFSVPTISYCAAQPPLTNQKGVCDCGR